MRGISVRSGRAQGSAGLRSSERKLTRGLAFGVAVKDGRGEGQELLGSWQTLGPMLCCHLDCCRILGAEVCRGSIYIFFLVAVTPSDKTLTKKERDRAIAEVGYKIQSFAHKVKNLYRQKEPVRVTKCCFT